MTRNKIKFFHTKWLLPLWILLIGSIVLYMIAHAVQQDDFRHIRTLAELNAVTYGDNIIADPNAGINITDTDRKSTRLNSSHASKSRMPSSA